MLTPELIGLLALATMWTTTLLVTAAGARDLVRLLRRRARLAPVDTLAPEQARVGTVCGTVTSPGTLAVLRVEEVGRAYAKKPAILLHPRAQAGVIEGGTVRLDDGRSVRVPPLLAAAAEVWRHDRAPTATPALDFTAALAEARRARGFARTVEYRYAEGDRVVLGGLVRAEADGAWSLAPQPDPSRAGEPPTLLVAAEAPAAWYTRKIVLSALALLGFLGSAALVTALVFTGPLFGLVSTLGGALGLAQFLGVQPLGVALRDAVTAPDRAVVHHDWAAPRDPPASDLARA
jgi:hypothetical protein